LNSVHRVTGQLKAINSNFPDFVGYFFFVLPRNCSHLVHDILNSFKIRLLSVMSLFCNLTMRVCVCVRVCHIGRNIFLFFFLDC
jgi:hypothetical protein